jgi:hypothetical protein
MRSQLMGAGFVPFAPGTGAIEGVAIYLAFQALFLDRRFLC